ncbi:polyamine aminopropyltransferase [Candidatus Formimonas warabiya]|uniref:Polyamine aminopropyltransferase n=1 Tax=Formimonas warabiya TaxID=1761012 RepID=A0A3G1KN40_FORW1|nr:polyamine aminopropyltransferase [Candidatus Formimonas warabiya]ATW23884.1 spermidine synthase [Candidatus Formimonas warabiya]
MKGLWYTEHQEAGVAISLKAKTKLHEERTDFQFLEVLDTDTFGRMLVLDGAIQTTMKDEFVYHEMISLVALNTHPHPENVLVVGGGDGGAIREIAKHPHVKKATLVEIDPAVIDASKKYFPEISCGLNDPKVEVKVEDGIKHIAESKGKYDVILVDSTDPAGPAVGLFEHGFYQGIFDALKEDGIFVAQTESPFLTENLIRGVFQDFKSIFPIAKLYLAYIPTYPSGMWSFTIGSKKYDPEAVDTAKIPDTNTRYYTPQIHKAAFALPLFVQDLLK